MNPCERPLWKIFFNDKRSSYSKRRICFFTLAATLIPVFGFGNNAWSFGQSAEENGEKGQKNLDCSWPPWAAEPDLALLTSSPFVMR